MSAPGPPGGGYMDPQAARDHFQGREIRLYGAQVPNFDGTTSYSQDYVPHPFEGRPPPRGSPGQWQGSQAKFDGQSTYSGDFQQKPLAGREPGHVAVYQPTQAPFDGTSTYGDFYKGQQLEGRTPTARPGQVQRNPVPFDGTTSYRNDFVPHAMQGRNAGPAAPYQPNSAPFDGTTTYKDNYVPHAHEARPQANQNAGPRPVLPFNGSTTYGEYFKPQPILPRQEHNRNQYQPNQAKFEGTTENMDQYRAWAMDPANRRGGPPPPMRPSLPFDGTTTNRDMFKGWQLPPCRPALGVQMVGDAAYVLIPANAPIPALGRQVFTTVHDNQRDIAVLVLEGDFTQASRCNVLGQFDLLGLPLGPAGASKIEVTFHVDQDGVLSVTALDTNTMRQEQWLREGQMVARVQQ